MENLETTLEQFGLKRNEALAYLALLRLPESSPHKIAKEAKLERTTIYKILENLSRRGLASKNLRGNRLTYSSEGPEGLRQFLNQQNNILNDIFPTLLALQNTESPKPKIRFYDNLTAIKEVYNDSLNAKEPIRRDIISIDNMVNLLGQRFVQNHTNERVKRKIKVHAIRSLTDKNSDIEKDWLLKASNKDLLREVRYLKDVTFTPLIMIYDQTLSMISLQKEAFALIVESKELSHVVKTLFNIAWEVAK